MKRKEFDEEDVFDDFSQISLSFPSRKSRRLDGELLPDMQIENVPEAPLHEQILMNEHCPTESSVLESVLVDNPVEDRALVLYNAANSSLVKSPRSPKVSITVHSDLVPGLKDFFHQRGNSFVKAATTEERATESDNHLAVVPYDPSRHLLFVREEELSGDGSDPMEAEGDAEMTEMKDDTTNSSKQCFDVDGMIIGTSGLQPWLQQQQQQQPQYCPTSQLFQNINMPVR